VATKQNGPTNKKNYYQNIAIYITSGVYINTCTSDQITVGESTESIFRMHLCGCACNK